MPRTTPCHCSRSEQPTSTIGLLAGPPHWSHRLHPDGQALYELARIGGKRALVTMCIGGGKASRITGKRGSYTSEWVILFGKVRFVSRLLICGNRYRKQQQHWRCSRRQRLYRIGGAPDRLAELSIKGADILRFTGKLAAARDYYREGLAIYKRIGSASDTIKRIQVLLDEINIRLESNQEPP